MGGELNMIPQRSLEALLSPVMFLPHFLHMLWDPAEQDLLPCREALRSAASNLPWIDVLPQAGANVYSILQRDNLVLSRCAVDMLVERLRRARS